jgi:hypothetical protein
MSKHLLIVGDLGAGANLVKNICLLDQQFDCPWVDRYKVFQDIYKSTSFTQWLKDEYKTRFWKSLYGFDLSDSLEYQNLVGLKKTVFINHSAFWEYENLVKFQESCDIVFVAPLTDEGLRWQIRAYVEKRGINNLHNFSFLNPEVEKPSFIEQHGINEYYKFNVLNMYEILKERRDAFLSKNEISYFDMTPTYKGQHNIAKHFNENFNLNIPQEESNKIFDLWYKCHWEFDQTDNWEWGEKYNGYNS